jgi:hypothetical protein
MVPATWIWLPGTHGDNRGADQWRMSQRAPLANLSLVWMLEQLERCEKSLPMGGPHDSPTDATAPSVGTWRGWAKLFGRAKHWWSGATSERLHASVAKTDR